jgi:hypothetical protein
MKILLLTILFVLQAGLIAAQIPPIGTIDFYGLRGVSEQRARQALQIKEGDAVPESREEAQRRLEALPNVEEARLAATCCEDGKTILYIGIREKGEPSLRFRSAPTGAIRLPAMIAQSGKSFYDALSEGVASGNTGEDYSQGHALSSYPKVRAVQERFIGFAAQDLRLLRSVLHDSADAQHRALAAQVLGYAANKGDVVKDLVYGMSDPESDVRNSAMRALALIANFAQRHSKFRIRVPLNPFIDLLNSVVWTDRNKSSFALYELTGTREPAVLSTLRERALLSLVEMSRWKSPGHAYRPFFLLGRVGDIPENEIKKMWDSGNREALIETVLQKVIQK